MTRSSKLPQVPTGVFGRADANIANNNILMNTHLSFHTKYQPPKCWMRANEWSYTNKRKTNDYFSHFSILT